MKIAGKKIENESFFIFLLFLAISIFSLFATSYFSRSYKIEKISQDFYSSNAIFFSINFSAENNKYIPFPYNRLGDNYILYKDNLNVNEDVRGIFFKGEIDIPPIVYGRFFDEKDFTQNKKYAVVGRDLVENLVIENSRKYYTHNGSKFEVIGTMGDKEKSKLDRMCMLNLDGILKESQINGSYVLDGLGGIKKKYENLVSIYSNNTKVAIDEINKPETGIKRFFRYEKYNILIYIFAILILVLSSITVTTYWIQKKRIVIAIQRMTGYSSINIVQIILKKYLVLATGSYLLGIICIFILEIFKVTNMQEGVSLSSILISYSVSIISGIGISIIPIYKALKIQISIILR